MSRYRLLPLAFLALVMVTPSSSRWQSLHSPTDLVPILCHKEIGVGILFIAIENHGSDAEPSTTTVEFNTDSPAIPQVQLAVQTPNIPSGADIVIAVDLPYAPGTTSFLKPVGEITITVDARNELPETHGTNNLLVTDCLN